MKMDVYQALKDHFADDSRVTVNAGRGAQGIKEAFLEIVVRTRYRRIFRSIG
jgi:hypothetical protein